VSTPTYVPDDQLSQWLGAPPDGYPENSTTQALVSSLVIATGRTRLFGLLGFNNNAGAQFIQVFDAAALPADGAIPLFAISASGAANFSASWGSVGRWFARGVVVCNSSTLATKTIGAADCWFDAQFGY